MRCISHRRRSPADFAFIFDFSFRVNPFECRHFDSFSSGVIAADPLPLRQGLQRIEADTDGDGAGEDATAAAHAPGCVPLVPLTLFFLDCRAAQH